MGWYGTDHNWQTPVSRTGERLENYPYLARSLSEIKKNQEDLTAPVRHDLLFGVKNDPGLIWKRAARASNDFLFCAEVGGLHAKSVRFRGGAYGAAERSAGPVRPFRRSYG